MKKLFLILVFFFLTFPFQAFGQTKTDEQTSQIDQLKNKVASKVAQLKLVEKRGTVGTVETVTSNSITINDLNDNTRIIDIDEFTNFSSEDNGSFEFSDIEKGTKISALGLYNKESQRLLARFINEVSIPVFLFGKINDKDIKQFTLDFESEDGTKYKVDVETITKTYSYGDTQLVDAGFSKISLSEKALIVAYPDPKEKDRLTAERIILFPNRPKNSPSPTPTE